MKVLMTIILIAVQILSMELLSSVKHGSMHAEIIKKERLSGVDREGWWTRRMQRGCMRSMYGCQVHVRSAVFTGGRR